MTYFHVFSDVDGTATNLPGASLCLATQSLNVQQALYHSLFEGFKGMAMPYARAKMLPVDEMVKKITSHFGSFTESVYERPDSDMLFSLDAIKFYKQVIKYPNASLTLITKNRSEYVLALLKYHGFTDKELAKIDIQSTIGTNGKEDVATKVLQSKEDGFFLVLDDSLADAEAMNRAIVNKYSRSDISWVEHNEPGQFRWQVYQQWMEEYLADPRNKEFYDSVCAFTLKDAMLDAIVKYIDYHQSPNKTKSESNRGQGAGFFSWLRHGKRGMDEAYQLYHDIYSLNHYDTIFNKVVNFLAAPHCAYEYHSLSSYLCDALAVLEFLAKAPVHNKYSQVDVVNALSPSHIRQKQDNWLNN